MKFFNRKFSIHTFSDIQQLQFGHLSIKKKNEYYTLPSIDTNRKFGSLPINKENLVFKPIKIKFWFPIIKKYNLKNIFK